MNRALSRRMRRRPQRNLQSRLLCYNMNSKS